MRIRISKVLAVTAAFSLLLITSIQPSAARGGGGGGGGGRGGGGFGRGGFDRGGFGDGGLDRGFDRGFDDGAFTPRNDDSGLRNDDARPSAFSNSPHTSDSALRSSADHDYGVLSADKGYGLPSDGGFGRVAMADTGRNYGNYSTDRLSPADLGSRAQAVRDGFTNYGAFDHNWWGAHAGSWYYPGWRDGWAWGGVGWGDLSGYWGDDTAPVEYDYGNNITYQNDEVYYGTQPTAPAATYYAQAQTLADTTPVVSTTKEPASDWKPLGVYSLTQGTQSNTTIMFQLAVNKAGAIRGNYYNALTQESKPVHGAVDKKDMRASWVVGNNKTVVYDTGLANLLKTQSTILVHLGKTQTQQWNLIKLKQPAKS